LTELSATAVAGGWKNEQDPSQNYRRSVYIFVRRNLPYPLLHEFDSANTFESTAFRKNTVTAPQSLDLMNSELMLDFSRAFAGRIVKETGRTAESWEQVDHAFKIAYGRQATAEEQKIAAGFLAKQVPIMAARLAEGEAAKPPMPANMLDGLDPARAAALVDLCQMLLASNEFLYIN
jgi:hypothetical protein